MAADSQPRDVTKSSFGIDDYVSDKPTGPKDSVSNSLREQGLKLAYQQNPSLERYVHGTQKVDLATKEIGAAYLGAALTGLAFEVGPRAGLVGLGVTSIVGGKGVYDAITGKSEQKEAKQDLFGRQYEKLLDAGSDVSRDEYLMTGPFGLSLGVRLLARAVGRPLTGAVDSAVQLAPIAVAGVGFGLSRQDSGKFDQSLDALARAALMENQKK